ncbi:MAG: DUF3794 domain-containing protein [Bacillota bacterium]|nr:DUF3794 domain-containing protein [Bacillota bacterium]
MSTEVLRDMIRFRNIVDRPPLQAFFEEDILVPDIKPDAARICSSKIVPRLTEKECYGGNLKLGGDLYLEVIYIPSSSGEGGAETAFARIPFRHEGTFEDSGGELEVTPRVEHLEVSIINERKFRMKTVISFAVREYEDVERNVFRGFREGDVEMMESSVSLTDAAGHKKDYIEVKDEIKIKEGMPEIGSILRNDFRTVETYRQITPEKAIISGTIYYDILYMSDESSPEPVWMSGTTDYTQFIKLDGQEEVNGSDIRMKVDDVRAVPKRDEEDNMTLIEFTTGISTRIDTYKEKRINLVRDAYHSRDIMDAERDEINIRRFGGSGSADASIREKIDLKSPEGIEKIAFISGDAIAIGGEAENGRFIVEGILIPEILYSCRDDGSLRSTVSEIPFKAAVQVPGLKAGMEINVEITVKNISGEKISEHQAEVYAEAAVLVKCFEKESISYIKNGALIEEAKDRDDNTTRLIMYVTKGGDTLWDIGKRYRTPLSEIKKINGMDENLPPDTEMEIGEKLLIWA